MYREAIIGGEVTHGLDNKSTVYKDSEEQAALFFCICIGTIQTGTYRLWSPQKADLQPFNWRVAASVEDGACSTGTSRNLARTAETFAIVDSPQQVSDLS